MKTDLNPYYVGIKRQMFIMFKRRPSKGWTTDELGYALEEYASKTISNGVREMKKEGTINKTDLTRFNNDTNRKYSIYQINQG